MIKWWVECTFLVSKFIWRIIDNSNTGVSVKQWFWYLASLAAAGQPVQNQTPTHQLIVHQWRPRLWCLRAFGHRPSILLCRKPQYFEPNLATLDHLSSWGLMWLCACFSPAATITACPFSRPLKLSKISRTSPKPLMFRLRWMAPVTRSCLSLVVERVDSRGLYFVILSIQIWVHYDSLPS